MTTSSASQPLTPAQARVLLALVEGARGQGALGQGWRRVDTRYDQLAQAGGAALVASASLGVQGLGILVGPALTVAAMLALWLGADSASGRDQVAYSVASVLAGFALMGVWWHGDAWPAAVVSVLLTVLLSVGLASWFIAIEGRRISTEGFPVLGRAVGVEAQWQEDLSDTAALLALVWREAGERPWSTLLPLVGLRAAELSPILERLRGAGHLDDRPARERLTRRGRRVLAEHLAFLERLATDDAGAADDH